MLDPIFEKEWKLTFTDKALKKFKQLPGDVQSRIQKFFRNRVLPSENPPSFAKALTGNMEGLWRFRVGDYRVVTTINNHEMIVVAIDVGHRKEVYDTY